MYGASSIVIVPLMVLNFVSGKYKGLYYVGFSQISAAWFPQQVCNIY